VSSTLPVMPCGLEEPQLHLFEVTAGLGTASAAILSVIYVWNVVCLIIRGRRHRTRRSRTSRPRTQQHRTQRSRTQRSRTQQPPSQSPKRAPKPGKYDAPVNPLSGFLASVIAIVLIVSTGNSVILPQPLESTALLVTMLAQVSVLGWQDHNPGKRLRGLVDKLADVAAVIVTAYALNDARNKYINSTGNEFYTLHDPNDQVIVTYVLSGIGCAVGLVQIYLLAACGNKQHQKYVCKLALPDRQCRLRRYIITAD
jgi:hypothetical protein